MKQCMVAKNVVVQYYLLIPNKFIVQDAKVNVEGGGLGLE